jgi:arsenite methyltransferase
MAFAAPAKRTVSALAATPNKQTATREFSRVLATGGRVGISDLTKTSGPLLELDGLLSWIACIGDAQPVESYVEALQRANLTAIRVEDHRHALTQMARQIQGRLLGVEIAVALEKIDFLKVDFSDAKRFAQAAVRAVQDGKLGYAAIVAVKSH